MSAVDTKGPHYIVKWPDRCAWCAGAMLPGDDGSYSYEDWPVHYACRQLEQP